MALEKKLGGVNAAYGQAYTPRKEGLNGSPRRAQFRNLVQRLPKEYQPLLQELLDNIVFKDELPPCFSVILTASERIEATKVGDTATFLIQEGTLAIDASERNILTWNIPPSGGGGG